MSTISDRLKSAQRNTANTGCVTCQWWQEIGSETRNLINEWIDGGYSLKQLYRILSEPADGDEPALPVSNTGFKLHMEHHNLRCREQ